MLSLTSTNAQIGPSPSASNTPNYGIYGSAPTPSGTAAFPCGTPAYAKLTIYPEIDDEGTPWSQTIPLNGSGNFNFYYNDNGTGFLSGGGYKVNYLNSGLTNCYGAGDIVSYSPNRAHTNGVQVRPFNSPQYIPYGIYGYALAKIPGGGGATTVPLENATAGVGTNIVYPYREKTNGVGYFNIYYSTNIPGEFVPYNNLYNFKVSGVLTFGSLTCYYEHSDPSSVIWVPSSDFLYSYDVGTIAIGSSSPGCAP